MGLRLLYGTVPTTTSIQAPPLPPDVHTVPPPTLQPSMVVVGKPTLVYFANGYTLPGMYQRAQGLLLTGEMSQVPPIRQSSRFRGEKRGKKKLDMWLRCCDRSRCSAVGVCVCVSRSL